MRFYLGNERITNLKEYLIRRIKRLVRFDEFWALREVSFSVAPREVLGVIGLNGAGKSTLLKLIAGIMKPTTGAVAVDGNISPLIELGTGFDPDLTARENVFLNGAVLGYQRVFLNRRFDEIIAFAELEQFVDVPLRNFSSGMVARLAFSIATLVDPEILLVDEILSVGDVRFQEKSEAKMRSMMEGGATVVFVSHNIRKVQEICHKVLWLEGGRVRMIGPAAEVCGAFTMGMRC
jgi:ABC-type polysaccharide/polyol phosphate transport system ATPase subunit